MRIRFLLLVLFGVLALAPVAAFGLWSYQNTLTREFDSVRDKHLLLARNLAVALGRYDEEISAVFDLASRELIRDGDVGASAVLLDKLNFSSFCITRLDSARVIASAHPARQQCPPMYPPDKFAEFKAVSAVEGIHFTGVTRDPVLERNVFHVVAQIDGDLVVGTLPTDYINELAETVSFGGDGQGTVLDKNGRVVAHPYAGWVANRFDLSDEPIVKRMHLGETGIGEYHSEASGQDMIGGYTIVPGAGWGVIVSQPIAELYKSAAAGQQRAITVLLASLIGAALLALLISMRMSRPIERVSAAIAGPSGVETLEEIAVERKPLVPQELVRLQDNYNAMVRILRQNQARIRRLAYTDGVTALPNRESFQMLVNKELDYLTQTGGEGALVLVNIDDFRLINDALGHDRGDQVLRAMADRLAFAVQRATGLKPINRTPEDVLKPESREAVPVIGSMGGDTFGLFLPKTGKHFRLARLLRQIRLELARPLTDFAMGEVSGVSNGASLGAAAFPQFGERYETLMKNADLALYHAKHSGKGRAEVFRPEVGDLTSSEMRIDVTRGLKAGEFILHYQPKVNSITGEVKAVEALIRWNHPERGLMLPNSFIPLVEHADVVVETGEWALGEAARQIRAWDEDGMELEISVNIAPRHFGVRNFARRALAIVEAEGVDPSRIEIEITEEAVLPSLDFARKIIETLRDAGFKVSLDDFGRGYSNLTRLAGLEVNTIKIDGPLTAGITTDERTRVIVASTIDMARGLGCSTVAEGVETLEQAAMLREFGCEMLQGFYFARPMAEDVLAVWVKDRQLSMVRYLRQQSGSDDGRLLRA